MHIQHVIRSEGALFLEISVHKTVKWMIKKIKSWLDGNPRHYFCWRPRPYRAWCHICARIYTCSYRELLLICYNYLIRSYIQVPPGSTLFFFFGDLNVIISFKFSTSFFLLKVALPFLIHFFLYLYQYGALFPRISINTYTVRKWPRSSGLL